MLKMRFRDKKAFITITIKFSGKPETVESILFKNDSPFARFQCDTIYSSKSCRNKTDVFAHSVKTF